MNARLSRRATTVAAASFFALAGSVGVAAVASAAPYGPDNPYTSVTGTGVCSTDTNTVTGGGFEPGSTVTVTVDGTVVSSGAADGAGSYSVTVPAGKVGPHTATVSGPAGSSSASWSSKDCTVVEGLEKPPTQGGTTPQAGGGTVVLAYTGVPAYALAGAAGVLVVGGATLMVLGRRRRTEA